ncbi:MAG: TM0106 family RecB-like putative nuclease, partial [Oxalobacteraceae bacterium]|nr:TM0106 family RecB-like putative nuclease [Oxalobacteraceae bacterium]
FEHEKAFARTLEEQAESFVDISLISQNIESRFEATCEAMRAGTHIIYQGTLIEGDFLGHADFLRRVETPSALGPFSYELLDTKLARSPKAKFVIQLGVYCGMLKAIQGVSPALMHVILGDRKEASFRVADYADYVERLKARFLSWVFGTTFDTYPEPCSHCDLCRWRKRCSDTWVSDDHLSLVANIQKSQIKKLQGVGVETLAALARLDPEQTIPGIAQPVLNRLSGQAGLQLDSRITGDPKVKLIRSEEAKSGTDIGRGFARMPEPDEGDLFFDMEGDPFTTDGLEYLFGLYYLERGNYLFTPFWAHDRLEERRAFEQFIDFVTERLRQYPRAHIYHYAAYEASALKKLMGLHGTREAEVDALLRGHKLVDLYRIVRESIQVSEPAYSIKNLERFYGE